MTDRSYFGCKVVQRTSVGTVAYFVFHARVKDALQWVGVKRSLEHQAGTQRVLREARMKAITRFLARDHINTIPNNILLAFEPGIANFESTDPQIQDCFQELDIHNECSPQLEWGFLKFSFEPNQPDHQKPALIVDGQHRFFGMANFQEENIPVLFVCLINAPLQEQAFQFIVVNSKAVKVPADNAKSIIEGVDEDALRNRLLKVGVKYAGISPLLSEVNDLENSPFRNLLDWDYNHNGQRVIPLTAIEQSLKYIGSLLSFKESEDDDSLLEIFFAIWNAVKASFPQYWENVDNKFMKKVNINALNEFLADRVKMAGEFEILDVYSPTQVENQVSDILKKINPKFWDIEWAVTIQDNANIRKLIKQDLELMARNHNFKRSWDDDLQLISMGDE